jgi:hypothetical protein
VAVQHSHSGKIGSKKKKNYIEFELIKNTVLRAAAIHLDIQTIFSLITTYITMPPPSKFKKKLRAQAALARCSRTSLASKASAQSTTLSKSFCTSSSSPTVTTTPSNTPDAAFDEEKESNQETFENVCLHLPDTQEGSEEDGYHTDDDLSELEDEELEESLKKQREGEIEQVRVIQDVFDTLMREVDKKEWKKAESNRSMGYGSKSSERTERWRRQKEREKSTKDAKIRNSSEKQFKLRSEAITYSYMQGICPDDEKLLQSDLA